MANKLPAVKVERPFEPKGDYYYEGVRYPQVCPASTLDALKDFDVNEDDIWILGFPKAGNTWITEIVYSILSGGNTDSLDIDHVPIEHDKLAFDPVVEPHYVDFVDRPSPRIIRSHLPYQLLPMQIKEKKPKTIYICRNAKDTMASFWFFVNSNNMLVSVPDWTDWFDSFLHEDNIFGSWFDHVTGFWNQCNEENFLFITYESMQKDIRGAIYKISEFLERPLRPDQKMTIAKQSSFEKMVRNPKINFTLLASNYFFAENGSHFLRKGVIGDWKNYFTVKQNELLDYKLQKKLNGCGLKFDYE